jgi:hypothetical protein
LGPAPDLRPAGTYDLVSEGGTGVPFAISPARIMSCNTSVDVNFDADSVVSGQIVLANNGYAGENLVVHGRPFTPSHDTTPEVRGDPTVQTCTSDREWQDVDAH